MNNSNFFKLSCDLKHSKLLGNKRKGIDNSPEGIRFSIWGFFLAFSTSNSRNIFLISLIQSSFKSEINYFQDKSNRIFIISSTLLILTTFINHFYHYRNETLYGFQSFTHWIGILNWIPYFYCYWAFQKFLKTSSLRKNTAINLVSGSIPLLLTSIGQYWFEWHGPFKIFNGLIIWFQRPIFPGDGITGLFNNSNYAGSWLVIILPFIIAFMYQLQIQNFIDS